MEKERDDGKCNEGERKEVRLKKKKKPIGGKKHSAPMERKASC